MFKLKKVLSALTILLTVSGVSAKSDDTTMERIIKTGEIRIAVQTQGPPVSFINKKGERAGIAIEMAQNFADDMGVELIIKDYDWKGLIPALTSKKVDFIAADMTPTPKRHMQMLFTNPAFFSENVVFTTKDRGFKSWKALNAKTFSIGAAQSTSYADQARKKIPLAKLKEYSGSTPQVVQSVISGRVDAGVSDRATLASYLKQNDNLVIIGSLNKEPLGFAVRPDSMHLLLALNNYIRMIEYDGRLEKMLTYWWESTDWEADHK